ncbi:MAG TPA: MmcQ/YjbR family DNA-binding protein [Balneolaceae bacterium]|nr:MmcQ/YjbR family DNA-binding protein [Balneolaceae bacterium]
MKFNDIKKLCLSFTAAEEESPYNENKNLVAFKVMGKVFAIANANPFEYIHLRCDPVKAATLRNLYEEVQPSTFGNKRRWNRIYVDGILDAEIIKEWVKDSYDLIFEDLPRKKQRVIEGMREKEQEES